MACKMSELAIIAQRLGFPRGLVVQILPANAGDAGDAGLIPGKISWRRTWQPTPVFLPGESYGQRSLAGYSSWGHKSDMTEATEHTHTHPKDRTMAGKGHGDLSRPVT